MTTTPTTVKERPILFSGEMIRAILNGRKTQTRRVMKPQPADDIRPHQFPNPDAQGWISSLRHDHGMHTAHLCPYGKAGERLWVRETWRDKPLFKAIFGKSPIIYAADYSPEEVEEDRINYGWKPSIHMPRIASRILLEITDVRVERLQDITEADSIAEGVTATETPTYLGVPDHMFREGKQPTKHRTAKEQYAYLWDSLNGNKPGCDWASSPWVWAISFKVLSTEVTRP